MTFPKTHANGEVWDGAAVTDLESRAAGALVSQSVLGAANGVGTLDGTGRQPAGQLSLSVENAISSVTYAENVGISVSNTPAANTAAAVALSLAAPGTTIKFSDGTYQFDCTSASPFTFPAGNGRFRLVGQGSGGDGYPSTTGPGTRLLRTAGTNPLVTNSGATYATRSRVDLQFIEINGGGTSGDVVVLGSLQECMWLDARITYATGRLTAITQAWNCRFTNCFFTRGGTGTSSPATAFYGRAGDGITGGCYGVHLTACEWEVNGGTDIFIDGSTTENASVLFYFTACKHERQVMAVGGGPATWPVLSLANADRIYWTGGSMNPGGAQAILTGATTQGSNSVTLTASPPAGVTTGMTITAQGITDNANTITGIAGNVLTIQNNAAGTFASQAIIINGCQSRLLETTSLTGLVSFGGGVDLQHAGNPDYFLDMQAGTLILSGVNFDPIDAQSPINYIQLGNTVGPDAFHWSSVVVGASTARFVLDNRSNIFPPAGQTSRRLHVVGGDGSAALTKVGSFLAWQMPHAATSTIYGDERLTEDWQNNVSYITLVIRFTSPSTTGNVRFQVGYQYVFFSTDVTSAASTVLATQAVNGTANHSTDLYVTVPSVPSTISEIKYAISRLGSDGADTCTGVINIATVEILTNLRK